ncbi:MULTISPECIES: thioesterase II family protein [Acetobacteraceae]|uniref:thioesterase II family protein n=1 Tax=Acetobacteraceae TaxID=433 RepID=UPI0009500213
MPWPPPSSLHVRRFVSSPEAVERLFCFPYSGAGASVFLPWSRSFPERIEVCAIEYPGRGSRSVEPLLTSVDDVVNHGIDGLSSFLDKPFSVLGYSLGAFVAFEWLHKLRKLGGPAPSNFFVCACRAPQVQATRPLLHPVPGREFIDAVQRRYGGIPSVILNEPELLARLLPILRADLSAAELYSRPEKSPLSCAIHVFGGTRDQSTRRDDLAPWSSHTNAGFSLRMIEGDHFLISSKKKTLEELVIKILMP